MVCAIRHSYIDNASRKSVLNEHVGLISKNGVVDAAVAANALRDQFAGFDESQDYVCTWFDQEIKQMAGIDVFSHPFDHKKGYTIITKDDKNLLILKTELLDTTFHEAISTFLDIDSPVELKNDNISEKKHYSEAIRRVRRELVIPDEILTKIYSTRYMRHFYPLKP